MYFARDSGFSRCHKIVQEGEGMSMMEMLRQGGEVEENGMVVVAGTRGTRNDNERELQRGGDDGDEEKVGISCDTPMGLMLIV